MQLMLTMTVMTAMRLTSKSTALQEAVRLLSRRALSEKELRIKLGQKGYTSSEIDAAVDRLISRGYLNDEVLCKRLFDYYTNLGGHGLLYILGKIKMRGLRTDCLNEQIADWRESGQEYEQAKIVAQQKFSRTGHVADKAKIARTLASKGFAPEIIVRIMGDTEASS